MFILSTCNSGSSDRSIYTPVLIYRPSLSPQSGPFCSFPSALIPNTDLLFEGVWWVLGHLTTHNRTWNSMPLAAQLNAWTHAIGCTNKRMDTCLWLYKVHGCILSLTTLSCCLFLHQGVEVQNWRGSKSSLSSPPNRGGTSHMQG